MIRILIISCLAIFFQWFNNELCSQTTHRLPCGTGPLILSQEQIAQRRDAIQRLSNNRSGEFQLVPLQFHLIGDDNGNVYFSLESMVTMICEINERYKSAGIQFYLWDKPIYVNNSAWYDHDHNAGVMLATLLLEP